MAARSFCALSNFTFRKSSNKSSHVFNTQSQRQRDNFSVQAYTESLPSSNINVEYLKREFSGHGAAFEAIGDDCAIRMELDEGTTASLLLPTGLITSYKPMMWHGDKVEVLHTLVSEDPNAEVMVQGGVSMNLRCADDSGFSWSPSTWALHDVRGSSDKFIQVELASTDPNGTMEAKCLVTLRGELISSELTITNPRPSFIQLEGSIMSHFTVSTPDAAYAVGLQGSKYCSKQAIASEFCIIPPESTKDERSSAFFRSLAEKGFDALFSGWGKKAQEGEEQGEEEGKEKEECNDYAQMTEKTSRIYTYAPVEFTVIDRGRRNSVVIERSGFEELYIFSPGSDHDWYGKYAFVCVGPCALLKPVAIGPGGIWKGAQYLYNPNL
uniref:NDH-dependent cyclic electron flow 5 n=1 Tax=Cypripedium formosanum TaxID=53042 RepID=A0A0F7GZN3_9ASPA